MNNLRPGEVFLFPKLKNAMLEERGSTLRFVIERSFMKMFHLRNQSLITDLLQDPRIKTKRERCHGQ